jgi:hypothetical protein
MARLDQIVDLIQESIDSFHGELSSVQKELLNLIIDKLSDLKTSRGKISTVVSNLRIIADLRRQISQIVTSDGYVSALRDFVKVFDLIGAQQTKFFQTIDDQFEPSAFMREMQKQMINQTVDQLGSAGIGISVSDEITELLRQNITSGSSYASLTEQLRQNLLNTDTDGSLLRYAKQITTDAVNQYSAQNLQLISSDLNYEWFRYAGHDIKTTRPFCDAMTDLEYFHICEIPDLLEAKYLYYTKDGQTRKVPIYDRTGLPHGMIEGTDASNFFVRRGGYNCGHQIMPTVERIVPQTSKDRVFALPSYKRWLSTHKKQAA